MRPSPTNICLQVEEFFRKMAAQVDRATELLYEQNEEDLAVTTTPENQVKEDEADVEVLQADALFSQLLSNMSLLHNQSVTLVKRMQHIFEHSFVAAFNTELQPSTLSTNQGGSNFFRTMGLDHFIDSMYDFGRNVLEELSSTVADAFEELQGAEEFFQETSRGICDLHVQLSSFTLI